MKTRVTLIAAILLGLALSVKPTEAQGLCTYFSDTFPAGWTILSGTDEGNFVKGASSTLIDSTPINSARVQKSFGRSRLANVSVSWGYYGAATGITTMIITAYLNSEGVASRTLTDPRPIYTGWFDNVTVDFGGVIADTVVIWVYHPSAIAIRDDVVLRVNEVCFTSSVTPTPSPTIMIPTDTPTATDTPTHTATPVTLTPTPSLSPTPITSTPTASSTAPPSSTPREALKSGGFLPAPKPKGCADPFDPCGKMPYAVPGFATLALASPSPLPSLTAQITATLLSNGTPSPGPTYTGTLPTGTFGPAENGVVSFATDVGGLAVSIALTPGVDAGVGVIGIRQSANEIGSTIGEFWGFIRAIRSLFLGRTGTIIAFVLLLCAFIVLVKVFTTTLPIILSIIRWVMRFIQTFKPI